MKKIFAFVGLIILILGTALVLNSRHQKTNVQSQKNPSVATQNKPAASFDTKQHSLTDPNSIWVVVNKQHALQPKTYTPADLVIPNVPLRVPGNESMQLRQPTATAMESMFAGAKTAGLNLMLSSGYRSYTYQVNLYNGYVASSSVAEADKTSARPGYSEHQTGLAADIEPASKTCEVETCFKDTPEGKWLAANAYKYGFIIRYTADKPAITGYDYEPWHVRFVGIPLATEMHKQNIETLEEFFNIPGGTTYK